MKSSKLMAVAVAAFFCVAAVGIVFSDESSAASTVGHNLYIEFVGDDGLNQNGYWLYFESENTAESFIAECNKVGKAVGLELNLSLSDDGEFIFVGYTGATATYIVTDGKWAAANKTAEEYPAAEKLMFIVGNGYIATAVYETLTDAEKAKWTETGMGWGYDYMRNPQVAVDSVPEKKDYHVFAEIIDDKGAVTSSKWVNFEGYKTLYGFVSAANLAFADNGLEKLVTSTNGSSVSSKYDGSGNTHVCYVDDGKWAHVTDTVKAYVESDAIALSLSHGFIGTDVYNALSDDDKKNWESSGMDFAGYEYQKVVNEPVDGYKEKNNNLRNGLIIGGVVVAILVLAGAFFLIRGKNQ